MSASTELDKVLVKATHLENEFNWTEAVEFYQNSRDTLSSHDASVMAQFEEHHGYALYRMAMQSESPEECKERIRRAISHYEEAKTWFEKSSGLGVEARATRCGALVANLSYWLASSPIERKKLLDESWRLAKKAFDAFLSSHEPRECGRTFNQLSFGASLGGLLEWEPALQEQRFREVIEFGERSISLLSSNDDATSAAEALVRTGNCLSYYNYLFVDLPDRERNHQRTRAYWSRARQLSEGTAFLATLSFPSLGYWAQGKERKEALEHFGEALRYALETGDNLLIGFAYDWLCYHTFQSGSLSDDLDETRALMEKTLKYAERAKGAYLRISFTTPREWVAWVEEPSVDTYLALARDEMNLTKRRELLQEAAKIAPAALKKAEASGYESVLWWAHHTFSKILDDLAKLESSSEVRRQLLEEALAHRVEAINLSTPRRKFNYFTKGIGLNYLANIKAHLSALTEDLQAREKLHRDALEDKEAALKLLSAEAQFREKIGTVQAFLVLGYGQLEYGDLLSSLGKSTHDQGLLMKAVEAFKLASGFYHKLSMAGRVAECYWRVAQVHDDLGEYHESAGSFASASNSYNSAAKDIPQLNIFYNDYAAYMQGWSEIEEARYCHARLEFDSARVHYAEAARLHGSTRIWSYLASNYSAWTEIEHAEDLSRKDQSEEALHRFETASQLFIETNRVLNKELGRLGNSPEGQMVRKLVEAAAVRRIYCSARARIEEARRLEKQGAYSTAVEKYHEASVLLEELIRNAESERDRGELKLTLTLSMAWEKMARAEAEELPELYLEASRLFDEAKELSPDEKGKKLALGHSRFCRALEAGMKFADTGDLGLHVEAVKNLDSAAKYYVKAGFERYSEYAKASRLLFDGYVYMDSASEESDQEKRAKLYTMAEKVLEASAASYHKAKFSGKSQEVNAFLRKIREERELASALAQILHTPSIISSAGGFAAPTQAHEMAVGLERFESADIQGRMIVRQKDVKVGELLEFEIELVNAGRGPARLMKIENLLPQSFDLIEKPDAYRLEAGFLNLKGKRLDELKIEEIRLVLRPRKPGRFVLTPRVQYADEAGRPKSQDLEAVEIQVKELGVSGWIKGSGR